MFTVLLKLLRKRASLWVLIDSLEVSHHRILRLFLRRRINPRYFVLVPLSQQKRKVQRLPNCHPCHHSTDQLGGTSELLMLTKKKKGTGTNA